MATYEEYKELLNKVKTSKYIMIDKEKVKEDANNRIKQTLEEMQYAWYHPLYDKTLYKPGIIIALINHISNEIIDIISGEIYDELYMDFCNEYGKEIDEIRWGPKSSDYQIVIFPVVKRR